MVPIVAAEVEIVDDNNHRNALFFVFWRLYYLDAMMIINVTLAKDNWNDGIKIE